MIPDNDPSPALAPADRLLLVTADDFGIGPETTRGILDAAGRGVITATVMLVNSPYAAAAVQAWEKAGRPIELGWHPALTSDAPVLPAAKVPTLVQANDLFRPLGGFLKRVVTGRLNPSEVEAELKAQLHRFIELVGKPPVIVNAHHHIHVFRIVNEALMRVLAGVSPRPLLRQVVESVGTLRRVPGARVKRLFFALQGRAAARRQRQAGFPGNDTILGVTDPECVEDLSFFSRWLAAARGDLVELACHPGHDDPTLEGRDDDPLRRRPHELARLLSPDYVLAVEKAGFRLATPQEMISRAGVSAGERRRLPQIRLH